MTKLTNKQSFMAGYLIAVANIVHTHDEPTIATDVLREGGFERGAMTALDLSDFDLDVLGPLFDKIEASK